MSDFTDRHPDPIELQSFVDGELDGEASRAIDDHLARCSECFRVVKEERKLASAVARLPREIAPPDDAWQKIAAHITGERDARPPSVARVLPLALGRALPARLDLVGGALAAAAAILCVLVHPSTSAVAPAPATLAVAPDVLASTWSPDTAPPVATAPTAPTDPERTSADEEPYRRALAALEGDFQRARTQLSPSDAAHLDESLRAIDEAIETTRAAVATHPDDFDLRTDLLEAYRDKVTTETDVIDLTTRT